MPTPAAAARAASHDWRVRGLFRKANSVNSGSDNGWLRASSPAAAGTLTAGSGDDDSQRWCGAGETPAPAPQGSLHVDCANAGVAAGNKKSAPVSAEINDEPYRCMQRRFFGG